MNTHNIHTEVSIGNNTLAFPVLASAGTVGYGEYLKSHTGIGAIVGKTLTKEPRRGNPPPVTFELPHGYLNSIGLKNIGVHAFVLNTLPLISTYPCPYIASIMGESPEEFIEIIEFLQEQDTTQNNNEGIWGWELNMSCPNVHAGTNFGKDPHALQNIITTIRSHTNKPLIVKLPPNVNDITILGNAAEAGGADAISAVNTFKGMWIDTHTQSPIFHRTIAGYSGEAIFPAALALVYELCQQVTIPVIGIGGIHSSDHALQYLLAGASAVQIGTANFKNPSLLQTCTSDIIEYCNAHHLSSIEELGLSSTHHTSK